MACWKAAALLPPDDKEAHSVGQLQVGKRSTRPGAGDSPVRVSTPARLPPPLWHAWRPETALLPRYSSVVAPSSACPSTPPACRCSWSCACGLRRKRRSSRTGPRPRSTVLSSREAAWRLAASGAAEPRTRQTSSWWKWGWNELVTRYDRHNSHQTTTTTTTTLSVPVGAVPLRSWTARTHAPALSRRSGGTPGW